MIRKDVKDFPNISIKPENLDGMIDFQALFGREAEVEMEIGSGKGTFLLEEAKKFPEKNFLGIEWANKFYKYAVDRFGRWGLTNVRIIRTDAATFIPEHIPDASISMFHLYFPDPWPKNRHNKRRFFCNENLTELLRILVPAGVINIATDHADYFEQMIVVADNAIANGLVEKVPFTRAAGARDDELVGTNYERKYIIEGRDTYTLALRKC